MTHSFFIKHTSKNSFENFNNLLTENKNFDQIFINTKFDDKQNFILNYNDDNSVKIAKPLEEIINLNCKIFIIKISGDNNENHRIFLSNLDNIKDKINDKIIIRINDDNFVEKTLDKIYSNCENIYDLIAILSLAGCDFELYYISNKNYTKCDLKSIFLQGEYKYNNIENAHKSLILNFKNFCDINKLDLLFNEGYKDLLIKIYFNDNNQKLYIYNYFNSDYFKIKNPLKNPDNFYKFFLEIINSYKNQIIFGQNLINQFLEIFLIDIINITNSQEISSNLKKIQIIAQNFDKYGNEIQDIFINQFFINLQKEKSNNLIVLYIMFFVENIIFTESKKKFIIEANKIDFFINRAIDLNQIISKKPKIYYAILFNAENFEYSFTNSSVNAYLDAVDKDNLLNILIDDYKTSSIFALFSKKKFINYIILNSQLFVINELMKYINKKFNDIEKNKIRYAISSNIFNESFIELNIDKIKALYSILPPDVLQKIPKEILNSKK